MLTLKPRLVWLVVLCFVGGFFGCLFHKEKEKKEKEQNFLFIPLEKTHVEKFRMR